MTPRRAYIGALISYGCALLAFTSFVAWMAVHPVHPAGLLLLPAGIGLLISGSMIVTNYKGVRDQLRRSPYDKFQTRFGFQPMASRFTGIIITSVGLALFGGGILYAILYFIAALD
jgi:hypothetical protein